MDHHHLEDHSNMPGSSGEPEYLETPHHHIGHKRKTTHVTFSEEDEVILLVDEYAPPPPIRRPRYDNGGSYVRNLENKYRKAKGDMMKTRPCTMESMSNEAVEERLKDRIDCDMTSMSCLVSLCGRVFDSIQVLAWHLSYCHRDLEDTLDNKICVVCGQTMNSARGKNSHLLTKHRHLASEHNVQCCEQRDVVIAPNTPAAHRIIRDEMYRKIAELPPDGSYY